MEDLHFPCYILSSPESQKTPLLWRGIYKSAINYPELERLSHLLDHLLANPLSCFQLVPSEDSHTPFIWLSDTYRYVYSVALYVTKGQSWKKKSIWCDPHQRWRFRSCYKKHVKYQKEKSKICYNKAKETGSNKTTIVTLLSALSWGIRRG